MASRDVFALQNSDLNKFLFAEVGTENNGMTLTVVSALARLGDDPWEEARRLATLPKASAISHLARIIAKMPKSPWGVAEAGSIAARLIPLLPTHPGAPAPDKAAAPLGVVLPSWTKKALFYGSLIAFLAFTAMMQRWSDKTEVAPVAAQEHPAAESPAPTTPTGAAANRVHAPEPAKP